MGDPQAVEGFDHRAGGAGDVGEARGAGPQRCGAPPGSGGPPGAGEVAGWQESLADVPVDVADAERVDLIAALERLKSAAAATQARLAAAMADDHTGGVSDALCKEVALRLDPGGSGLE